MGYSDGGQPGNVKSPGGSPGYAQNCAHRVTEHAPKHTRPAAIAMCSNLHLPPAAGWPSTPTLGSMHPPQPLTHSVEFISPSTSFRPPPSSAGCIPQGDTTSPYSPYRSCPLNPPTHQPTIQAVMSPATRCAAQPAVQYSASALSQRPAITRGPQLRATPLPAGCQWLNLVTYKGIQCRVPSCRKDQGLIPGPSTPSTPPAHSPGPLRATAAHRHPNPHRHHHPGCCCCWRWCRGSGCARHHPLLGRSRAARGEHQHQMPCAAGPWQQRPWLDRSRAAPPGTNQTGPPTACLHPPHAPAPHPPPAPAAPPQGPARTQWQRPAARCRHLRARWLAGAPGVGRCPGGRPVPGHPGHPPPGSRSDKE